MSRSRILHKLGETTIYCLYVDSFVIHLLSFRSEKYLFHEWVIWIFQTSMHIGYAYATFYEYQDQIPPEASLQSNKSVAFFVIYLTCPGIHAIEWYIMLTFNAFMSIYWWLSYPFVKSMNILHSWYSYNWMIS